MERLENIKVAFGALFFAANNLETLIDRYLSQYNLTTKQFFLSLVLIQHKDEKPALTLGQVSKKMGTSRQNVKQLALKLEQQGFCKITSDKEDKRVLRLTITKKNTDFWNQLDVKNIELLNMIFHKIDDKTLASLAKGLKILNETISGIEDTQV